MEVIIKNDSFIESIALELNKESKEVIELLNDFCKKNGVEFEPQDNSEKLMFFIEEATKYKAFEVCYEAFKARNMAVVLYLNQVRLETIGNCEKCGGEILDIEAFKNGIAHSEWKMCEECKIKY